MNAPHLFNLNQIILNHSFQILIGTIEIFCKNNGTVNIIMDEYYKRLLNPLATCLHRYIPQAIYCSFRSTSINGIDIKKYDLAENRWNDFKEITFDVAKNGFGSVLVYFHATHHATMFGNSQQASGQPQRTYFNNVSLREA